MKIFPGHNIYRTLAVKKILANYNEKCFQGSSSWSEILYRGSAFSPQQIFHNGHNALGT